MKFIYSLMLITFLMTTFAAETGWGSDYSDCMKKNVGGGYKPAAKTCEGLSTTSGRIKRSAPAPAPVPLPAPVVKEVKASSQPTLTKKKSPASATKPPAKSTATPAKEVLPAQPQPADAVSSGARCDGSKSDVNCKCNNDTEDKKVYQAGDHLHGTIYQCVARVTPPNPIPQPPGGTDCLATARQYLNKCNSDSTTAVNKCDPEAAERDTDSPDVGQILKQIGNAAVAKGAGSGAYDACLKTALASQGGYYAINEYKSTNCDPQVDQCKSSCEAARNYISENKNEILGQCLYEFYRLNEPMIPSDEQTTNYRDSVVESLADIEEETNEGKSNCEVDAVSMQDKLKQTTNDFSNAAKQAQVCRCQTGSTGEDCSAIKGPAQCALNPNAVGCALSTVNCNNSDSIQCRCLKNPNLAECKTGGGGRESGLVGKPFSTPSSSIGSGVAPKISNGDFDISFADEASNAGVSGTEGVATSPFGSAQASGGGGAGASGAGAGTGEGDPAADAEGKTGLNALLDKPKGFIGGMLNKLGFGPNAADKKYKTDANGKKIDPNKWKPGMLRGVAGNGSEIGPKHRDIWKAMNSQYFLQEKTFIDGK